MYHYNWGSDVIFVTHYSHALAQVYDNTTGMLHLHQQHFHVML